jgi:predicted Zn-dependent peptidase
LPTPFPPSRLLSVTSAVFLGLALVAAPAPGGAQSTPDGRDLPVREVVLDNGMHFLILPRAGAPTVSFVVHVPVGSVNEAPGPTGVAHFLEHLLFKGTEEIGTTDVEAERRLFALMDAVHDTLVRARGALPEPDPTEVARLERRLRTLEDLARAHVVPGEYDRILSREGARGLNASTGYEETEYFVSLPANRAKLWFVLEADRMANPVFREFFTERDVVTEERRARIEASPGGLLYEAHMGAAFRVHPYGVHPIGHMPDIQSISRDQVEAFYRRHYVPNNTIVVIVGAIDPDSAAAWARDYFGRLERGPPPPPVLAREPEQRGERRVEVLHDAESELRIGWKVPGSYHPDAPALSMLANILAGGRDSRLYRRVVRDDRLATFLSAGPSPAGRHPGLFTVHVTPRAPHTPEEVEAAIYDELARLLREPPTAVELERVRTRLEASRIRRLTSNQGLAFQLAESQAVWGDWRETFGLHERMQAVTAADIVGVVERYFRAEGRTVALLRRPVPEAPEGGRSGDVPPGEGRP